MQSEDLNTSALLPTYFHHSPISEIFLERQVREILPPEFQFYTRERQHLLALGSIIVDREGQRP